MKPFVHTVLIRNTQNKYQVGDILILVQPPPLQPNLEVMKKTIWRYPAGSVHYPNLFGIELHYFAISTQSPNPFSKADSPVQCVLLGDCIHDRVPMFFFTSNAHVAYQDMIFSLHTLRKGVEIFVGEDLQCVSSVQLDYSIALVQIRRGNIGLPRHVTDTDIAPLCIQLRSTKSIGPTGAIGGRQFVTL